MGSCLIVDDSRIIRMVARKIVHGLGFDVAESGDGLDALQRCAKAMPDVIILDWKLPQLDGIAFLARLRAMPGGEQPAVLFCTTKTEETHIRKILDTGATDYVVKPFDGKTIESKFAAMGVV